MIQNLPRKGDAEKSRFLANQPPYHQPDELRFLTAMHYLLLRQPSLVRRDYTGLVAVTGLGEEAPHHRLIY